MIADVAIPVNIARSFHYRIPENLLEGVSSGSVVEVSFHNRKTHAFVLGVLESTDVPAEKLKDVQLVHVSEPIFSENMFRFLKWVSDYYCYPIGEVIDTAVPRPSWQKKNRKKKETAPIKLSLSKAPVELNAEQSAVLEALISAEDNKPFLVHGVTGSGKTEIYIRFIETVFAKKQSAIVLVPEIALTPQLVGRFSERFSGKIAVIHSDLSEKERAEAYEKIREWDQVVVIGARSAVFAPVKNLGVVVVDEEHETTYKQEDHLRYHARDIAIVRAQLEGARVILGSATPSLESLFNSKEGKYHYLQLKKRVEDRPLPVSRTVDLKNNDMLYEGLTWFSRPLKDAIADRLQKKEQTLLYLNRLGFSNFLYCQDCGHTFHCLNCDVALTFYQSRRILKCHYCDLELKSPTSCEKCQGIEMKPLGVGTEQVQQALQKIFPEARIERMDRSQIQSKEDLESLLEAVYRKDVDILIGTQMVTKGHDFVGVSLVGILLADASLNIPDFRAEERTYQVLTQVSGRAGRHGVKGEVILQTFQPEHPVLLEVMKQNSNEFYERELNHRKMFLFPPFQRLALLRFQHSNKDKVAKAAHDISEYMRQVVRTNQWPVQILGPSEAPMSRVRNKFRWQCLIKSGSVKPLQNLLKITQSAIEKSKLTVQVSIDVDPISTF